MVKPGTAKLRVRFQLLSLIEEPLLNDQILRGAGTAERSGIKGKI